MGDGKLKCYGSSLYLKSVYGVGYNMTLEKKNPVDFDNEQMSRTVQQYIPEAKLLSDAGTELSFQLPLSSSDKFQSLFDYFDDNETALGIRSYGMSVTTLEEVFIKVAHGFETRNTELSLADEVRKKSASFGMAEVVDDQGNKEGVELSNVGAAADVEKIVDSSFTNFRRLGEDQQFWFFIRHMHAMIMKRALYFSRDKKAWVFMYGFPILLVLIGMIVQLVTNFAVNQPALVINTSLYNGGISSNVLPSAYNDASTYCISPQTGGIPQCSAVSDQAKIVSGIPSSSNYPTTPVKTALNITAMSNFIYNNRNKYQASQFGAFSLYNDTITDGKISFLQYLVHANYTAVFGMPLFQTLVAQGVLQSVASSASLQLSLQPLPYTQTQLNTAVGINVGLIADFVMLAIPWVSASYASYIVREREVKSKHVQMVSGVSIYAYWLGTWIWDFVSKSCIYIRLIF